MDPQYSSKWKPEDVEMYDEVVFMGPYHTKQILVLFAYFSNDYISMSYRYNWYSAVYSGNSKHLNSEQSLISEHFWWNWAIFYNINYMLNSEHLSLVNKIGDKTEFTITRVHCTKISKWECNLRNNAFIPGFLCIFYAFGVFWKYSGLLW